MSAEKGRAPGSIHKGHRERLREEFMTEPSAMHPHKLLELLLFYVNRRGDTNPIAHGLLDRLGSVSGVLDATPQELCKVDGVGPETVILLKLVKELSRRYVTDRIDAGEIVRDTHDMWEILAPHFFGAANERIGLLCMDGKGKCLGVRMIGEGSANAAQIVTRKVAEAAFSLNATCVVLAHNHPSGVAVPSQEDWITTETVDRVLHSLGVVLVDHLVLVDDDMVSMKESGFRFIHGK